MGLQVRLREEGGVSALSFEYTAVDGQGASMRGVANAASKAEAYRQLVARGLTPVSLRPTGAQARSGSGRSRVATRDLAHFTYQFGVLVEARIPIADGLSGIADQEKPGPLRDLIEDVVRRIQSGESVSQAMHAHRSALGEVYVETIRAAEKAGALPQVLHHLSEMLERSVETSRQVRTALMYPLCVVSVLVLAVTFLVGFVIPKFATMFARQGADLPLVTDVLMRMGLSFQNYWWAYLAALVATAFGLRTLVRRPGGTLLLDRWAHRVPYIRRILIAIGLSRFCRILGLSLASGLGLIESLRLAGKASGRPLLDSQVQRMAEQVRGGARLSQVLQECGYVTPFAKRMLAAGESSSDIPRMCVIVSKHYERESSELTRNLSTVLEPFLVVAIAGVVLLVAMAIFLPMWDSMKMVG